jgi:hypothetical protein
MQELHLRKFIKSILSENDDIILRQLIRHAILSERSAGSEFDAKEKAAKESYESAKAKLDAWFIVKQKYDLWMDANRNKSKAKKDTAGKPSFPEGTTERSQTALEKDLEKTKAEYAKYNPEVADYAYKIPDEVAIEDDVEIEGTGKKTKKKKPMLEWDSDAFAMRWTSWPRSVEAKSGTGFGKQKKSDEGETIRGEVMGTGPGERWLSHIFGGGVAGGSVSFDVKLPDGSKCEVKELGSASALVRPGTHGMAAYERARDRLSEVMDQMSNFVDAVTEAEVDKGFTNMLKPIESKIIAFTKNFISEEFEMMVSKGEISNDRLMTFRKVLLALKALKEYHSTAKVIKPTVTLNKKTVNVSQPTFIDIAKTVKKDVPESDVLSDFETWEVILGALKDSAFTDPTKFLDEWSSLVDPEEVFKDTDGLFIVNEAKGFYWIPKSEIKSALRFEVVSQGKPKFRFLNF